MQRKERLTDFRTVVLVKKMLRMEVKEENNGINIYIEEKKQKFTHCCGFSQMIEEGAGYWSEKLEICKLIDSLTVETLAIFCNVKPWGGYDSIPPL